MNVIVYSTSPLGCLVACALARRRSNNVALVFSQRSVVDRIRQDRGILFRTDRMSSEDFVTDLHAFSTFNEAFTYLQGDCNCVIVAAKAFETIRLLRILRDSIPTLTRQKTVFCLLQDSLATASDLEKLFAPACILLGTYVISARIRGSRGGMSDHGHLTPSTPRASLMVSGSPDDRLTHLWPASGVVSESHEDLARALNDAHIPVALSRETRLILWKKLAVSCAVNAVTSLTFLRIGDAATLGAGVGRDLMLDIATEVGSVARAEGVTLSDKEVESIVGYVVAKSAEFLSEMSKELLLERQTEIENLNGFALRCAKKHRIETPLLKATYGLIRLMEKTYALRMEPLVLERSEGKAIRRRRTSNRQSADNRY